MPNLGVIAAVHMTKHGEEYRRLSDWLSKRLEEDALLFGKVLHLIASRNPTFMFWRVVSDMKDVYESERHWKAVKSLVMREDGRIH